MPTPEEKARQEIDRQLAACGWLVQDHKSMGQSGMRGDWRAARAPFRVYSFPSAHNGCDVSWEME